MVLREFPQTDMSQELVKLRHDLFWAKVQKADGCWLWTACVNNLGYGRINVGGTLQLAHRVSWALANGRWPELCVLHSCDNPRCVNPAHLREGTRKENTQECWAKGRGHNNGYKPGEKHRLAKLAEQQAQYVIDNPGESQHSLARKFRVSRSAIKNIRQERSWLHLERPTGQGELE